jgi:mannitol operon repressor
MLEDDRKWDEFWKEFQHETPRAVVILSSAFMDSLLHDLLASFLINSTEVEKLLGNENDFNRPLSNFGSRITLAYCLGLISDIELNDLRCINKIRNKFAHKIHGLTFDSYEIVSLCNKLQIKSESEDTTEQKFIFSASYLLPTLDIRISDTSKYRLIKREDLFA